MAGKKRNINLGANTVEYSGRGRPRTKEIVDRPLPVGIVLSGSPSTGDLYKNRKIRVGGPFQAKVPKKALVERDEETGEIIANHYESSRPLPERVSGRYPHLTRQEQEEAERAELNQPTEGSVHSAMDIDNATTTNTTNRFPHGGTLSYVSPASERSVTSSSQKTGSDRGQDDEMNDNEDGDEGDDEDDSEEYYKTKRGGLLVSPADTDPSGDYWSFVGPLLLTIENSSSVEQTRCLSSWSSSSSSSNDDSKLWQSQILQWHLDKEQRKQQLKQQQEELEAHLPKKRGRKPKRKKEEILLPEEENDDVFEWYTTNITRETTSKCQQQSSKRARTESLMGTDEERAQATQHLWLRHKAQGSAAQLETMVQLSAGKATLARRLKTHKRLKQPSAFQEKTLWRLLIEQSILGLKTSGFGDLTRNAEARYPFPLADNDSNNNNEAIPLAHSEETDVEVQKEIWKAILAFGSCVEEQLSNAVTTTNNNTSLPKLSTLMSFLNHAYQVRPIPEDIFRAPSVPPEINNCLNNITAHTEKARNMQAELMDLLYNTNHGGVDIEALQKLMEKIGRTLSVELDEAEELNHQLKLVADWQNRLDALMDDTELCLSKLEEFAQEGRNFAFRCKGLVQLEHRIHKAYLLRDRIDEWKKSCMQDEEDLDDKKESVKFIAAMVRDAGKLKFGFPEVTELLETYRAVEAWIDRANIAIRSRISLTEIKTLIETGDELPVDLSDFMEKLRARVSLAEEWIDQFKSVVPCSDPLPMTGSSASGTTMLRWMTKMREKLLDGNHTVLHDLASEGSRIPVEVDCVKLLQVEIDAKNWTAKAKKWIPGLAKEEDGITCRRGKIDDLREHLEKAVVLREKLVLPPEAKSAWVLDGEEEMSAIVDSADEWYEMYKPYLDWDNRRTEGRSCLSIKKLRTIVSEGAAIHANIGNGTAKMSRILGQAEDWMKAHEAVLSHCNVIDKGYDTTIPENSFVTVQSMTNAVEAAASDVSLDLDEAMEVKKLVENVKDWSERVLNAAPKRSKRQGRGRKARVTVDEIVELINEATDLPVDTREDVNRLQMQVSSVQEWRAKARQDLESISSGFQKLREVVDDVYGSPSEYSRGSHAKSVIENAEPGDVEESEASEVPEMEIETDANEEKKVTEDMSVCDTSSTAGSEQDGGLSYLGSGNCNVNKLIKAYRREAKSFGVISKEVEAADKLEKISSWCVKSLKYLDTQREVFDRRFFGAFDRFLSEGRDLVATPENDDLDATIHLEDGKFADMLNTSWKAFVSDQLQRLEMLVKDRERFIAWCDKSEEVLFSDEKKRPSLEKLKEMSDLSKDFPSVCDMVQKVRGLYYKAMEWVESTGKILASDEKLCRQDAKVMLEEGEKLGILCEELKTLRNAHRTAKSWAGRVKKCRIGEGATDTNEVQELLDEYDSLLIEMPEELSKLQSAVTNYCICRRPYAGFMIGCDECEEWYHGCCVGISESKADKVDKYVCVRCCTSRVFKNSSKDVVAVVKKWTCQRDFKKARQMEAQKHQRKVRKETKDIEKLQAEIQALSALPERPTDNAKDVENVALSGEVSHATEDASMNASNDGVEVGAKPTAPAISPEEAQIKIEKASDSIRRCQERLSALSIKSDENKRILDMEDSKAPLLKNWCLRVRTLVLFPRSEEDAKSSRPNDDGSLSPNMQALIAEAKALGIDQVADVETVINAFGCMAWGLLATSTLAKKSSLKEYELLVSRASPLKFPDEKAIRTIKSIYSRGTFWQGRVRKALSPVPGDKKGFDLTALKELEDAADDIPVRVAEESLLSAAIEEKGERHCICGGPSDARFMLSCDKCENWFHGPCVNMTKDDVSEETHWVCPPCKGATPPVSLSLCGVVWEELDDLRHCGKSKPVVDISREAPDASKMWPPFGLFGSKLALEALGEECSAIPDADKISVEAQNTQAPPVTKVEEARSTQAPPVTKVEEAQSSQPPPVVNCPGSFWGVPPQAISDPITRMHVANAQRLAAQSVALQPNSQSDMDVNPKGISEMEPQAYPWVAQPTVMCEAASSSEQASSEQPHCNTGGHNPIPSNGASEGQPTPMERSSNELVKQECEHPQEHLQHSTPFVKPQLPCNSQLVGSNPFYKVASDETRDNSLLCTTSSLPGLTDNDGARSMITESSRASTKDTYSAPALLQNGVAKQRSTGSSDSPLSQSPELKTVAMEVVMAAPLPVQENGR